MNYGESLRGIPDAKSDNSKRSILWLLLNPEVATDRKPQTDCETIERETTEENMWNNKKSCKFCVIFAVCLVGITSYFLVSVIYQMKFGYLKDSNVLKELMIDVSGNIRIGVQNVRRMQEKFAGK